jgi:two-component system, chemotaxis family, protein-glutamate methylesterase/glutaminase
VHDCPSAAGNDAPELSGAGTLFSVASSVQGPRFRGFGGAPVNRDIVVIGASAGGIDAVSTIVRGLPANLQAAIFVVLHTSPQSPGYLADILDRAGSLPAKYPSHGEVFYNGMIYVAPPDHHLMLDAGRRVQIVRGPRENRTRPAVDPLFRSAALTFGTRVIGVVLSGGLDDGTAGLRGIKMCGGTTIVQDPDDALAPSMPASALRNVSVDYCKPAGALAALITTLVEGNAPERSQVVGSMKRLLEIEVEFAKGHAPDGITELGDPSLFTCPECHGALLKMRGEKPLRYRCHTGHAFTADSLLAELSDVTEEAIWNAVRSIQETSMLMSHLAKHWRESDPDVAEEFLRKAKAAQARADQVRSITAAHPAMSEEKVQVDAE